MKSKEASSRVTSANQETAGGSGSRQQIYEAQGDRECGQARRDSR